MKRSLLFLLVLVSLIIYPMQDNVEASTTKVAVFYSPHQDDEVLTMGHAITKYVLDGFEVHVVLLTDGSRSNSIHKVNDELELKMLAPLSVEEFSYARNLEFVRSLAAMGVSRENIHMEYLVDGKTTKEEIVQAMLQYITRFPSGEHHAFTYNNAHIDHKNSGLAIKELIELGVLEETSSKYYIQNRDHKKVEGVYEDYKESYLPIIQNASDAYLDWHPLQKLYSIGGISVPHDFNTLSKDPRSKYHLH
ncbi:hypothetical protein Q75_07170 [Bacillus coahuilensis p1.1.43]|uniref:GlcNAc-PI de-N-acetylase n=1 Tax=Bacillus coahuilensis p1.1.43 TaxID=1150625 RepID=A0A147K960_9BACI|nr:PIG-L family deacetylase [Bacillus coahuilensis]KUP06854.1 hypothetical protein Q75_07170 [Bacillus coahuilensis p1.1.43]